MKNSKLKDIQKNQKIIEDFIEKEYPEDFEYILNTLRKEPKLMFVMFQLISKDKNKIQEILPNMIEVSRNSQQTNITAVKLTDELSKEAFREFKLWLKVVKDERRLLKRRGRPGYI